jgi:hypothetical protein
MITAANAIIMKQQGNVKYASVYWTPYHQESQNLCQQPSSSSSLSSGRGQVLQFARSLARDTNRMLSTDCLADWVHRRLKAVSYYEHGKIGIYVLLKHTLHT